MAEARRLYKVPEVAENIGFSRAMVNRWIASGELGSVKIGTARRIPAAELDAFVERLRIESGLTESGANNRQLAAA